MRFRRIWITDGGNAITFILAVIVSAYVIRKAVVAYGRMQNNDEHPVDVAGKTITGILVIVTVVLLAVNV